MDRRFRVLPHSAPIQSTWRVSIQDFLFPENSRVTQTSHNLSSALNSLNGTQVTESENHPAWLHSRKGRFQGDLGGPFSTSKRYCILGNPSIQGVRGVAWSRPTPTYPGGSVKTTTHYEGIVLPAGAGSLPWPTTVASTASQLDVLGTQAIARCAPSNPSIDLAVTIGELVKEGIPRLIGSSIGRLRGMSGRERRRALGSEYLNVEFGWKPLINDMLGFCRAIVDSSDALAQYERDSGRVVRRRYDFPELVTTKIDTWGGLSSPWTSPSGSGIRDPLTSGKGQVMRSEELRIRRWFSGAFTYYVPPASSGMKNSMARDVILARKALGLSLTPDTIWNLGPWSWMFDWFFNAGDLIRNWTNFAIDNQVLLYGYIMEHKIHSYTYTFTGPTGYQSSTAYPSTVTLVSETKVRRKATPYGFGSSWNGFSGRQLAILAALGLTKS